MTEPSRLSRRGGELLLRILEQRSAHIAALTLEDFPPDLPIELINLGALEADGISPAKFVATGNGEVAMRDLDWHADTEAYGYFDQYDGRVVVPHGPQKLYKVAFPWWLAWLAKTLDLSNSGRPTELVPDIAWDIGDLWVTRQRTAPLLFARRLHRSAPAIALQAVLARRAGRSGGLILTSQRGRVPQDSMQGYAVVPIGSVLTNDPEVFSVDRRLLLSPFIAPVDAPAPTQPLYLSSDGRQLIINGDVIIEFKSDVHVRLIRRLVEGHHERKRWRAQELLEHAKSNVGTLARAFGAKRWQQLRHFITSRDGLWGFDL